MEQKRLFWAIDLPDDVKRKLFGVQSRLREVTADVKWVEQHNFHLTVKFLGDIQTSQTKKLIHTVSKHIVNSGSFVLDFKDIGFFPGVDRPKIIWIGVRGEVEKYKRLHQKVEEAVSLLGYTDDSNRFSPHLTLGRIRSPRGSAELIQIAQKTAREADIIGSITVSSIYLMESQLTYKGPVYNSLASLKL